MNNILIPVDPRKREQNILHFAVSLFGNHTSQFVLYYAVDQKSLGKNSTLIRVDDIVKKKSIDQLRKFAEDHENNTLLHGRFSLLSDIGNPQYLIDTHMTRDNSDMLVLGTKTDPGSALSPEYIDNIVSNGKYPILLLSGETPTEVPEKVVFLVEAKDISDKGTKLLKRLFEIFDFKCECIFINEESRHYFTKQFKMSPNHKEHILSTEDNSLISYLHNNVTITSGKDMVIYIGDSGSEKLSLQLLSDERNVPVLTIG